MQSDLVSSLHEIEATPDATEEGYELTPFGRHLLATVGMVVFCASGYLVIRAAVTLPSPFPIWEILGAIAGVVIMIGADPESC